MTLSSICIRDVAAYSLPRSASPMLLEFMFNKLLLLSNTIKAFNHIRAGSLCLAGKSLHLPESFCNEHTVLIIAGTIQN